MIGRTYLERGHPVVVLIRWSGKGPRNVLIERQSGDHGTGGGLTAPALRGEHHG